MALGTQYGAKPVAEVELMGPRICEHGSRRWRYDWHLSSSLTHG